MDQSTYNIWSRRATWMTAAVDVLFGLGVLIYAIGNKTDRAAGLALSILDFALVVLFVLLMLKGIQNIKSRWIFPYLLLSVVNIIAWIVLTVIFFYNISKDQDGLGLWWLLVVVAVVYWIVRVLLQLAVIHTYYHVKNQEKGGGRAFA